MAHHTPLLSLVLQLMKIMVYSGRQNDLDKAPYVVCYRYTCPLGRLYVQKGVIWFSFCTSRKGVLLLGWVSTHMCRPNYKSSHHPWQLSRVRGQVNEHLPCNISRKSFRRLCSQQACARHLGGCRNTWSPTSLPYVCFFRETYSLSGWSVQIA